MVAFVGIVRRVLFSDFDLADRFDKPVFYTAMGGDTTDYRFAHGSNPKLRCPLILSSDGIPYMGENLNDLPVSMKHRPAVWFVCVFAWPKQHKGRQQYQQDWHYDEYEEQKEQATQVDHLKLFLCGHGCRVLELLVLNRLSSTSFRD